MVFCFYFWYVYICLCKEDVKEIKTEFLFFSLVEVAGLLILCLYFVDVRFTFCSHFVCIGGNK